MHLTLISHKLCPFVQRAAITLSEKNVSFERIDIDLANKPAWFIALSPLGKTPVLKVGDHVIFESVVICEYLDETFAPALHPADPLQRAQHRAWVEFASAMLNATWSLYTAVDEEAFNVSRAILAERFARLEQVLDHGPYFGGAQFSLVDAAFAPLFRYFDLFDAVPGLDLCNDKPKIQKWRNALAQRASVIAAVSDDYPTMLKQFVISRKGLLGKRLVEHYDAREMMQ